MSKLVMGGRNHVGKEGSLISLKIGNFIQRFDWMHAPVVITLEA